MTKVLEVRNLVKEFPGVKALQGVDLEVLESEVHCLLGPNGAGKSTLIKCVSGALEATSGEILFQGEPLPPGDPAGSLRRGVATIYQELDLVPDLSVAESIFLAHEPRHWPLLDLKQMYRESEALLARLGHESIPVRAKVGQLRPAAQQVVSIARALSGNVRLLIMDEPSAILDEAEIATLFEVVRRLNAEGVGVIYITHRLDEIRRIGDRVTVLADGQTTATGIPATTPTEELIELMIGRRVEQLYPDPPTGAEQVLLEVRGARRLPAVREANLEVRAGEIVGLGGLVGSGRTELLHLIYGLDRMDEGEIVLEGKPLKPDPRRAIRRGLGLAPEDRKSQALVLDWSGTKNVTLADLDRFSRGILDIRKERKAAHEQLRALNTVPDDPITPGPAPLGREPAEGRARALAPPRVPRAAPRRADARRRHLDQGRDLPHRQRPRERRIRRARGLVGARGARPHLHADPRHARGRDRCRGGRKDGHRTRAPAPCGRSYGRPGDGGRGRMRGSAFTQRMRALEFQEYALALVVIGLFVAGAILRPDTFPTTDNVRNMLTQASVVGVLAIGMTFVIATAGIDLSVGSMVAAAGVFGGILLGDDGTSTLIFIVGVIGFAAFLGTVNATSIAYGRVVPFIATLAMFSIARGLALLLNDKLPVSLLDLNGGSFGRPEAFSLLWFGSGRVLGIPPSVYIFIGSRSSAGSCSTGRVTAGTSSPWAETARPRASRASPSGGSSSASTCSRACSPASPRCSSAPGSEARRR